MTKLSKRFMNTKHSKTLQSLQDKYAKDKLEVYEIANELKLSEATVIHYLDINRLKSQSMQELARFISYEV